MNEAFPVNTLYLMRGAIYAKKNNLIDKYNEIMFNAMWVSNINLSEPENIVNTLDSSSNNQCYYYHEKKIVESSIFSNNIKYQDKLWELSEKNLNFTFDN